MHYLGGGNCSSSWRIQAVGHGHKHHPQLRRSSEGSCVRRWLSDVRGSNVARSYWSKGSSGEVVPKSRSTGTPFRHHAIRIRNHDVIGLRVAVLAGSIDANPPHPRIDRSTSVPIATIIFRKRNTNAKYFYYYHRRSIWLIWDLLRTPQVLNL